MFTRQTLSRRTLLRGAGVAMSLPFLEAMAPRASATGPAGPKRMVFMYVPNGTNMARWAVRGEGATYELSRTLEPVARHREDMLVMTNLTCDKARSNGDGGGDHSRAGGAWLTCVQPRKSANYRAGISADQIAASRVGHQTRLPSLEMGIEAFRSIGGCDDIYSCAYVYTLSWRAPTSPIPSLNDPRAIFRRLFAARTNDPEIIAQNQFRASILDSILDDAHSLDNRLGAGDHQRFDQYLTTVRELEDRINRAEQLPPVQLPSGATEPRGIPADLDEHFKINLDLMAMALQTDVTRVITFMFGRESSDLQYPMIGVPSAHHGISHHQNQPHNLDQIARISEYHLRLTADFLDKLKGSREGDGNVLDNCMIAYGSCIADPDRHLHDNLPMLLFGKGGGTLHPGRHVRFQRDTPIANLWLTMLDKFGTPTPSFGDSTGMMREI